MIPDYTKIFNESQCLTANEMMEYLSGTLTKTDKQRIEMHLADCEMCNDELEGLVLIKDRKKLNEIITQLNSKIIKSAGSNSFKVKPSQKFNIIRITAIAASAVLIIFASIYLYFVSIHKTENLAEMNKSSEFYKEKESRISPYLDKDSLNSTVLTEKNKSEVQTGLLDENHKHISSTGEEVTVYLDVQENEEVNDKTVLSEEEDIADDNSGIVLPINKEEIVDRKINDSNLDEVITESDSEKSKSNKKDKNIFGYTSRSVPSENAIAGRNSEDRFKSLRTGALFSYEGKVYSEALDGFNQYLEENPNDIEILYKAGMCNYYLSKYSLSITQFELVLTKGSGKYYDDAEWYKVQALIKQNNLVEAKKMLNQIVSKNGKYKSQAQKLLNEQD